MREGIAIPVRDVDVVEQVPLVLARAGVGPPELDRLEELAPVDPVEIVP